MLHSTPTVYTIHVYIMYLAYFLLHYTCTSARTSTPYVLYNTRKEECINNYSIRILYTLEKCYYNS